MKAFMNDYSIPLRHKALSQSQQTKTQAQAWLNSTPMAENKLDGGNQHKADVRNNILI